MQGIRGDFFSDSRWVRAVERKIAVGRGSLHWRSGFHERLSKDRQAGVQNRIHLLCQQGLSIAVRSPCDMDQHVRCDPRVTDGMARGGEEAGGCQTDSGGCIAQGENTLDASLAIGCASHNMTTLVVMDGPGKDLAGTGRIAVDQYHDGQVPGSQFIRLDCFPVFPGSKLNQTDWFSSISRIKTE